MTEPSFKVGDEVQHKTGTAKMVYVGDSQLGDALCEWTDASGHPQRASFAHAALKKYEKSAVGAFRVGRS